MAPAHYEVDAEGDRVTLSLAGDWTLANPLPAAEELCQRCRSTAGESAARIVARAEPELHWDSHALARLLHLQSLCEARQMTLDWSALPTDMVRLLDLATAVPPGEGRRRPAHPWLALLGHWWLDLRLGVRDFAAFIGETVLALGRFLTGRGQTRLRDLFYFIDLGGPRALAIVGLISVLVGMILAYLGSVQLRQFGAEIYVANLVAVGMVREMGPLMTAVILAGRTGAAYAAQLGSMQANEEIDAVTTLGLSPHEYLVVPRLLALVLVMPLLVIYADVVGLAGGALVASGMDISLTQFLNQLREAVGLDDIATGLIKSLVFAALIAVAGCQSGLQSGRSSAAVGGATTRAVVHAIVYLVVADAALNILYDRLGV